MKSNIVKGAPTISSRARDTMMLGEVPICVIRPPSSAPNDIGIMKLEGEVPERLAIWNASGIMMANAPTFLTKADRIVTVATSTSSCRRTECTCREMRWSASSGTPVWAIAALTTRALPTITTISSLKPVNAWSGLTRPAATEASNARHATMS